MSENPRKCADCDHNLFTKFYEDYGKYYCDMCHPDKIRRVKERREFENILLGIKNDDLTNEEKSRLEIFYETIIENKNKQIEKLEKMNKKLTNDNAKLTSKIQEINNYQLY